MKNEPVKKVLLASSYFLKLDPKQWKQQQPYPPLATLYAAAVLRQSGYFVSFFDTMFCEQADDIAPVIKKEKPDYLIIYEDGFNYLTKMCLTNMRDAAFRMAGIAKRNNCTVIVSGSDSTDHYEKYLLAGADFIVMGEGENTLKELLNHLSEENTSFEKIPGIAFLNNGNPVVTSKRNVMQHLDDLPLPAWDLIDIQPYRQCWEKKWGYFSINMTTTRGCPFKCNWCAKPIYGNRYNSHSPARIVKELALLLERFKPDHIWFCDDIFGLTPGWISEFAALVKTRGLSVKFKIQSRVDLLLRENNIASLAEAGCETVWVGAESGSQKILDAMDKGTTVEQIHEATRLLKKHGIKPAFFLQFGYPGETKEDIALTLHMLFELMPEDIGISVSYPLPGTKFYERVKSQLDIKANWTDSDDLALMFKNTYPAEFYKQLHRFVHKKYRKKQAEKEWMNMFSSSFAWQDMRKAFSLLYYLPATALEGWKLSKFEK